MRNTVMYNEFKYFLKGVLKMQTAYSLIILTEALLPFVKTEMTSVLFDEAKRLSVCTN
jgi:hypothetical protein